MQQQIPQNLENVFLSVHTSSITEAPNLIRFLEELSMNAWPALRIVHYDGWVLRFANGYSRRSNSVNPVFSSSLNVDDKIKYCEEMFRAHQLTPTFKMTPQVYPENLDDLLARKWYQEEAGASVHTLNLSELEKPTITTAAISEHLTDEWLNTYCRMNRVYERHIPTLHQILSSIAPRHCFVTLLQNGEPASVGMGVVDRGCIGLFDIVTDERRRNRGLGKQLALHLLHWGKANGAAHAFLQVRQDNAPACHLYAKLGFKEAYQYWYRVKANT